MLLTLKEGKSQYQHNFQFLESITSMGTTMLFDIYTNDIYFGGKQIDICNFTYNKAPYVCCSNLKSLL